ncbi:DUF116 domain-containing protein [Dissulfurispira sp.]|uniref:DUF116 domain-containing protein n=1 Tax=Dissulfurispira sp. TaxID=2817609 RepID=UPI002FD88CE1
MTGLFRAMVLKVLYPMLMLVGAFSKDKKERLQLFIVDLNNRLVRAQGFKTKRILLLLPHCLQINDCDVRITNDIYNCKRCGRCNIKDLISVADENNLKLFVATGGNLARRIVSDVRPEAVVAVACERDLSSGIADAYPLPVLGIPNERPFGPCFNTRVDLTKVKEAIEFFGK